MWIWSVRSRRRRALPRCCSGSAADPLNLTGIVTPGDKVPALLRNRVHYRNGIPVGAWLRGDYVHLAGAPTGIGDMPHFGQASREFLTR